MKKAIIFDASTLITFSMNGLIDEIMALKKIFKGKFLITNDVKREVIDKPLTIKRFELEALRIKQLLDEKVLEMPSSLGLDDNKISQETREFKNAANSIFIGRRKKIKLIDSGEASCLALSRMLDKKNVKNVLAIDERTLRMLCEKPENLKKLMEKKLHTKLIANTDNYKIFKGFKIIRSSELVYVSYKKGLIRLKKGPLVLDALLYAVKFKGCSISGDEIREIKAIG